MNILKTISNFGKASLGLLLFSLTASPIASYLGVTPPATADVTELARYLMLAIFVTIIALIAITGALGYFILTGWRGYKSVPKLLRIVLSFILGTAAFLLSAPIGTLMPLPIVPAVMTAIIMWAGLRWLTRNDLDAGRITSIGVSLPQAVAKAGTAARHLLASDIDLVDAVSEHKRWKICFRARDAPRKVVVNVDSRTGEVLGCKTI